jgi:micrococcal nuclease
MRYRFFAVTLSLFAFSQTLAALPEVKTYGQLVTAIRQTRTATTVRIEQAVDREKIREAWETGKLIEEHVLQHKERADYDRQVIERLAGDLQISASELYRMLKFAKTYPILARAPELSWSHIRELLSIEDESERERLLKSAQKNHWSRDELRNEIRKTGKVLPAAALTPSHPGKPYTYKIIRATKEPFKDKLAVDLGFSNYHRPKSVNKFKEGDIVTLQSGKLKKLETSRPADLYTYKIDLVELIDGDTLTAVIDLGFDIATVQTLRLRGLDAPEIISREGKEAKAFVEKQITGKQVLIKTVKSDKYDRYLADVFVNGEYLNQKLLEQGLAVLMED